jgi:DNA mismatch endonuclease (patch repair protein)
MASRHQASRSSRPAAVQPAPSYAGFRPSSDASSRAMQANRARDTLPELQLRQALSRLGLRYRLHSSGLPGRPDIVFPRARLAVFCDGDFWHGRRWRALRRALKRRANAAYWIAKIGTNRQRDTRSRRALRRLGWHVVSLWETDIRRDPEHAALVVMAAVDSRLPSSRQEQRRVVRQRRPAVRKGNTA